jgi:hypothetical protein
MLLKEKLRRCAVIQPYTVHMSNKIQQTPYTCHTTYNMQPALQGATTVRPSALRIDASVGRCQRCALSNRLPPNTSNVPALQYSRRTKAACYRLGQ